MSFDEEEKGEGSLSDRQQSGQGALEQAETYIEEFIQSQIDLVPTVHGPLLYHKGEKALAKQKLHYFILRPLQGDILCIQKKETYDHIFKNENIPMNKLKGIEIIDLNLDIQSVYQSFRPIFSEKDQFAIELLPSDQDKASDIFFLSNFD